MVYRAEPGACRFARTWPGSHPTDFLEPPSSSSMTAGPKAKPISGYNIPWNSDRWCLRDGWEAGDRFVPLATVVCLGSFSFWHRSMGKTQSLPSPRVWTPRPRACWARVGMSEARKAKLYWGLATYVYVLAALVRLWPLCSCVLDGGEALSLLAWSFLAPGTAALCCPLRGHGLWNFFRRLALNTMGYNQAF